MSRRKRRNEPPPKCAGLNGKHCLNRAWRGSLCVLCFLDTPPQKLRRSIESLPRDVDPKEYLEAAIELAEAAYSAASGVSWAFSTDQSWGRSPEHDRKALALVAFRRAKGIREEDIEATALALQRVAAGGGR